MRFSSTTAALLFALTSLAGCATDGSDASGAGGGGAGGKADDGSETGLHVRAEVTTLGPYNEIRWPVAVDDASDVDDIINKDLSFTAITGENLEEIKKTWSDAPDEIHTGLDAADFTVTANMRNVLSVALSYEWLGAYPDTTNEYRNYNANTGATVAITDILDASSLPSIAAKFDEELQARIAQLKIDLAADIASGDIDASTWDGLHVTEESLATFSTTPEGITFHYDAGFPHVIQALEPDGEFSLTIDELDSAISADGLWAGEF